MERHVERLETSFGTYEAGIEEQKKALLDYMQKEFAATKLGMMEIAEEAKKEFHLQRTQLQSLYEATALELAGIKQKCEKFETATQGHADANGGADDNIACNKTMMSNLSTAMILTMITMTVILIV